MRVEDLSPKSKQILLRFRQKLAEDAGIERAPDELLDDLRKIDKTLRDEMDMTLIRAKELWSTYSDVPAPPPSKIIGTMYPCAFDDIKEASDFKAKAEHVYSIRLEIIAIHDGTSGRTLYRLRVV